MVEAARRFSIRVATFGALARRIRDESRLGALWVDTLDDQPTAKSYGDAIAHVLTHTMHHRAELLHILSRLGVPDLPEGNALRREAATRSVHGETPGGA